MQPAVWPDWLDDTWAKSAGKGEQRGESLAQHTWLVLSRLTDLQRLRPELPKLVSVRKLWHYLFWTCLLHDFGKAAQGFQNMLRGNERWPQRHEALSLVFVDWIAGDLSADEQRWIVAGIASHHRDAKTIDEAVRAKEADAPPRVTAYELGAPVWLDVLVARLLAPAPTDRYASAREVINALAEAKRNVQSGVSTAQRTLASRRATLVPEADREALDDGVPDVAGDEPDIGILGGDGTQRLDKRSSQVWQTRVGRVG